MMNAAGWVCIGAVVVFTVGVSALIIHDVVRGGK